MLAIAPANFISISAPEGRISRNIQESEGATLRHVLGNSMGGGSYVCYALSLVRSL